MGPKPGRMDVLAKLNKGERVDNIVSWIEGQLGTSEAVFFIKESSQ